MVPRRRQESCLGVRTRLGMENTKRISGMRVHNPSQERCQIMGPKASSYRRLNHWVLRLLAANGVTQRPLAGCRLI
jgi:hypothetical protein